jgi:hypothetical protein
VVDDWNENENEIEDDEMVRDVNSLINVSR